MTKPLLPIGCYDLLPPYARQQSELSSTLLHVFESFGYEQVAPPLLEYSDNLLAGRGSALSSQIFRVMDPHANKVMGLRADITLQVARIATTRLSHAPRPLRLCYNGLILRMQGEQLRGNRQLRQAGIELIGPSSPEADAEVICVAAQALRATGVQHFSIDLNLPGIVSTLLAAEKLEENTLQALLSAVAHKDVSSLRRMNIAYRETIIGLLQATGDAHRVLPTIERLDLPDSARRQVRDLMRVTDILRITLGESITLTIDATESRGAGYHSGISFSIFVPGITTEVGRGGRYRIQAPDAREDSEATGFTLYVETLIDILPKSAPNKRILVASGIVGITQEELQTLKDEGYTMLFALEEYGTNTEEAKRLGCNYIYINREVKEIL
jgi:ATP phosphoribosyltransferase regulatory subunit